MNNNTLSLLVNGVAQAYTPKSINGQDIFIGTTVTLLTPEKGDNWFHGRTATVEDCDDKTGNLLVIDNDGDFHCVEPDRVAVGEFNMSDVTVLETLRAERIANELKNELDAIRGINQPVETVETVDEVEAQVAE